MGGEYDGDEQASVEIICRSQVANPEGNRSPARLIRSGQAIMRLRNESAFCREGFVVVSGKLRSIGGADAVPVCRFPKAKSEWGGDVETIGREILFSPPTSLTDRSR